MPFQPMACELWQQHFNVKGIHIFTETNSLEADRLVASCENAISIANRLRDQGYPISLIDFGGGMGVPYSDVDEELDVEKFGHQM